MVTYHSVSILLKRVVSVWLKHIISIWLKHMVSVWLKHMVIVLLKRIGSVLYKCMASSFNCEKTLQLKAMHMRSIYILLQHCKIPLFFHMDYWSIDLSHYLHVSNSDELV